MSEPVFFIDRCLGRHVVPNALRSAGADVRVHDDLFAPGVADVDWLSVVGERGWFVISQDGKIRYRALERNALINAKVGAFLVSGGRWRGEDVAQMLVHRLPAMLRLCNAEPKPFIATVSRWKVTIIPHS